MKIIILFNVAVDPEKILDFIVVVTAVMGAVNNVVHDNHVETLRPLSRDVFQDLEVVYTGGCVEFEQECNLTDSKNLFIHVYSLILYT